VQQEKVFRKSMAQKKGNPKVASLSSTCNQKIL